VALSLLVASASAFSPNAGVFHAQRRPALAGTPLPRVPSIAGLLSAVQICLGLLGCMATFFPLALELHSEAQDAGIPLGEASQLSTALAPGLRVVLTRMARRSQYRSARQRCP
jgi:hypothetical protein